MMVTLLVTTSWLFPYVFLCILCFIAGFIVGRWDKEHE
jgi:hypothetical protein